MTSEDPAMSMSAKVMPSPVSPTATNAGRSFRFTMSRGADADDDVDPSKQEQRDDEKREEELVPFFSLFRLVIGDNQKSPATFSFPAASRFLAALASAININSCSDVTVARAAPGRACQLSTCWLCCAHPTFPRCLLLCRTADTVDYIVMAVGIIGALGGGLLMPLFSIVFGVRPWIA
jgi:hypothetical protein